jgi:hypothetical protein
VLGFMTSALPFSGGGSKPRLRFLGTRSSVGT